jgi:hypothetical protein
MNKTHWIHTISAPMNLLTACVCFILGSMHQDVGLLMASVYFGLWSIAAAVAQDRLKESSGE